MTGSGRVLIKGEGRQQEAKTSDQEAQRMSREVRGGEPAEGGEATDHASPNGTHFLHRLCLNNGQREIKETGCCINISAAHLLTSRK